MGIKINLNIRKSMIFEIRNEDIALSLIKEIKKIRALLQTRNLKGEQLESDAAKS